MKRLTVFLLTATMPSWPQDRPASLPEIPWHLTARPWQAREVPKDRYLDVIEGICRFTTKHQDERGAVIDAFLGREHQYSTPYFAHAVGVLLKAGRGKDLLDAGARAMDHSTRCFEGGSGEIPDAHGEFFIPALTAALELYHGHVSEARWRRWRDRLRTPIGDVAQGGFNNWRTYAMKGEWMRARAGLVTREDAARYIAFQWLDTQRSRLVPDKWNLYHDHSSDPESHAVEGVGRGNLLALLAEGYDGPYAGEMRAAVERGTRTSLLLVDPTGQCPMNGRTDNHIFNDVLIQLSFEVMAERARAAGDARLAGQYRRAALMSFESFLRWRREDELWKGSFFITKNKFDSAERVGYQPASNYGNYNGATMMHLAEAWLARQSEIEQQPAPVEIGGYVIANDWAFGSVFANAGGMQVAANLRGDEFGRYGVHWTPLGIVRFGRPGWETRLGPSDGVHDYASGRGVSFAPEWKHHGRWVRLAELPRHYRGKVSTDFVHPLLVRYRLEYRPIMAGTGPWLFLDLTITPDGVLAAARARGAEEFGVTIPLLSDDGTPLENETGGGVIRTRYPGGGDEQSFLVLGADRPVRTHEAPVRSSYGWLRPVGVPASDGVAEVFVYPKGPGDPEPAAVRSSFRKTENGFSTTLASIEGNLYIGRTSAGGEGRAIDVNGDGRPDVTFGEECQFVLQLREGRVMAIETDRAVTATVHGRKLEVRPFTPVHIDQ
jgi:hypothetical protein